MTGIADSLGLGLGSVSDYCVCVSCRRDQRLHAGGD